MARVEGTLPRPVPAAGYGVVGEWREEDTTTHNRSMDCATRRGSRMRVRENVQDGARRELEPVCDGETSQALYMQEVVYGDLPEG